MWGEVNEQVKISLSHHIYTSIEFFKGTRNYLYLMSKSGGEGGESPP